MKTKYLIASLLASALTLSGIAALSVTASAAEATGIAGDVNGDGTLSFTDAELMQNWLLSVSGTELKNPQDGDMNADGRMDARDLTLIKNKLMKGDSGTAS
ncbi:MAG: dockerin type I repeat-containing protein, partial [Oscillospiraceae bacterium]|nr:dockerin type I repeat-containing protein [Oscillospiraceae bacterium]